MRTFIVVIHSRTMRRYERTRPPVEFLHASELLGPLPTDCFQFARQYTSETTARCVLSSFVASDSEARGEVWAIETLG